jgi:AmmeMemoRadiSam system protein A
VILGGTRMRVEKASNLFWRPYLFCAFFIIALFFHIPAFKAEDGNQVKPEKGPGIATTTSSEKGREKEAGMANTDKLTEEQGKYLVALARRTIERALSDQQDSEKPDVDLPPIYDEKRGTFVTLTIGGNLRGCIGHIIPQESLIEGIKVNAINAAFRDPRFRRLTKGELEKIHVEISILTEPKPLSYSDGDDLLKKLRPDVDGVIIKQGYRQATFLPQVWEQLPSKEDFLSHLCLKAGLSGDAWRMGDLEVSIYQVQAFEE